MIRLQEGRDTEGHDGGPLPLSCQTEPNGSEPSTREHRLPGSGRSTTPSRIAFLGLGGRWQGTAGAYGVQDGDPFVTVVRGSFSNVVGLPMERLAAILSVQPSEPGHDEALRWVSLRWRTDIPEYPRSRTDVEARPPAPRGHDAKPGRAPAAVLIVSRRVVCRDRPVRVEDDGGHPRPNMAEAAAPPTPAPIDGKRAFGYLQEICKIGPRHRPARPPMLEQRAYVAKHFGATGATVREQPFSGIDPRSGAKVEMSNLIGSWHPERTRRVLLSAHYDTRPFPDEERNPSRRTLPFIGANDGASGVALLMEIANHLKSLPTPWGR